MLAGAAFLLPRRFPAAVANPAPLEDLAAAIPLPHLVAAGEEAVVVAGAEVVEEAVTLALVAAPTKPTTARHIP